MKKMASCLVVMLMISQIGRANVINSITYGPFGKIIMYHPTGKPTSVALFVSGDGGWNKGVHDMAKNIAAQGALVLGIDAKFYKKSLAKLPGKCAYPAADFEQLSLMIQRKYAFPAYVKPVLVGYSYGASLIYGILAQAPANTFKGAIALGFCPDIDMNKPLCKGTALLMHAIKTNHSYYLDRTRGLTAPFVVLNGINDQTCPYAATSAFLKGLPNAQLVGLNKVGHGFSVNANWVPQFKTAYTKILAAPSFNPMKEIQEKSAGTDLTKTDLPLTLLPSAARNDLPLVFFISGDGGWTSFDQSVSESMVKKGMSVVGLDVQEYFWKKKTPEQTAADVGRALAIYMQKWHKTTFVLAGYSFGASVIPFIANRLPADMKLKMDGLYCFSPDERADFEIHILDMLHLSGDQGDYDVVAEMNKVKTVRPICLFGRDEDSAARNKLRARGIKVVTVPGGHHYDNNFKILAKTVLDDVNTNRR
jgi:type IV secretory pathway VirJ component